MEKQGVAEFFKQTYRWLGLFIVCLGLVKLLLERFKNAFTANGERHIQVEKIYYGKN